MVNVSAHWSYLPTLSQIENAFLLLCHSDDAFMISVLYSFVCYHMSVSECNISFCTATY